MNLKTIENKNAFPKFYLCQQSDRDEDHFFNLRYDGQDKLGIVFRANTRDPLTMEFLLNEDHSHIQNVSGFHEVTAGEMFEFLTRKDSDKEDNLAQFESGWNSRIDGTKCPHVKVEDGDNRQWEMWNIGWRCANASISEPN